MQEPMLERARALIDGARSRGQLKRDGAAIDADPRLRDAVIAAARAAGNPLPPQAADWPGKRLLRRARARDVQAQQRTTPIARDEAFTCAHCGLDVPAHGRTARDHCPACLRSLHVDVVPGDRAAGCGGLLDPIGLVGSPHAPRIRYRCRRCGAERVNQAILDGAPPDDWAAVIAVSSSAGPA